VVSWIPPLGRQVLIADGLVVAGEHPGDRVQVRFVSVGKHLRGARPAAVHGAHRT
jgi:hypothetical protein